MGFYLKCVLYTEQFQQQLYKCVCILRIVGKLSPLPFLPEILRRIWFVLNLLIFGHITSMSKAIKIGLVMYMFSLKEEKVDLGTYMSTMMFPQRYIRSGIRVHPKDIFSGNISVENIHLRN